MGRRKAAQLRRTAEATGWLDVATPLPGDGELAVHRGSARTQPAVASLAEPHRERITRWWRQSIQGTTINGAPVRSYGFTGSYSSVRRFLASLEAAHPQVITVLEFDPGEMAKVEFGKDPEVLDTMSQRRAIPRRALVQTRLPGRFRSLPKSDRFAPKSVIGLVRDPHAKGEHPVRTVCASGVVLGVTLWNEVDGNLATGWHSARH